MKLFSIIFLIILFSILANLVPKKGNLFFFISLFFVFSSYFMITKHFYHINNLYPSEKLLCYHSCVNYYNLIVKSLKNYKLYICEDNENLLSKDPNLYKNYQISYKNFKNIPSLFDTSYYKGKLYLYFGITPVLLFYLPFNLITNLYLTDKLLVLILSCFIFLFSLIIIKKISDRITVIQNIPPNILVLCIFITGFCNLLPFLVIKSSIYEVAITTAIFLLLLSIYIFYNYMYAQTKSNKYILLFCLSFTLCLSVGARPYYVLFIPIFFIAIIWLTYKETESINQIIVSILYFLIPCLLYGTIIALYNYLRFDSIFEFGWKYQLNPLNQYDYFINLQDLLKGLCNNFFHLPLIDDKTFFSLSPTVGHSLGNDEIVGFIWSYPLSYMLIFLPIFLKKLYKHDIKIFTLLFIMIIMIIISIIVTSFIGMITRYMVEYLSLINILSLIIFIFYINYVDDKNLKKTLNFLFIIFFAYSMFINISLLFCKKAAAFYAITSADNYKFLINLLF